MYFETIKKTLELLSNNPIDHVGFQSEEGIVRTPIYSLPFQIRCYECYWSLRSNQQPFLDRIKEHEHKEFELVLK